MALVAGVDSSTQSTKVEVRDADSGKLVASARAPHPPTNPPRSETDPAAWWAALADACARCGAQLAAPTWREVAAVAVAAQQHGMVVLGANGEVLRPAKLWNDTEAAPDAAALVTALPGGAGAWARACGSVPVAAFTIAKLAWLARCEPETMGRLSRVLLPHDWLTWRLTGRAVTDRGDASGTGYWSPAGESWRPDLLALVDDRFDWPAALPEVLGPAQAAGPLLPAAAEELGLGSEVVVGPGTGDNMGAALGMGLGPGDVAVSVGTSGTVFAVSSVPTSDESGAVAGFADASGRFLPLVCTLNATRVTDAFGRLLGVDREGFDRLVLAADPGAGGVVLVPYLDGERTPNRPLATGTLTGLRADISPAQVARAAVEGVVCGLLDGLDALAAAGVSVAGGRLVLIGGGARSAAFRQVLADLSGRAVEVPGDEELVAKGACVQAAATLEGASVDEVARAWSGTGAGALVAPSPRADAAAIRGAYAAARG